MERHILRPTPDLRNQELRGAGLAVCYTRAQEMLMQKAGCALRCRAHGRGAAPRGPVTFTFRNKLGKNHYGTRRHLRQGHSSNLRTHTRAVRTIILPPLPRPLERLGPEAVAEGNALGGPGCLPVAGHHADALTRLFHIKSSQKDMTASL